MLLFGGTTEGRELYEALLKNEICVTLSVATEYGKEMVDTQDETILAGRMEEKEMESLFPEYDLVVDATHPHARKVSESIREACGKCGVRYLRTVRQKENADESHAVRFDSIQDAVAFLDTQPGNILVTTGTNELGAYTALKEYRERIYARALPTELSVGLCRKAGLSGRHIIGMQGPFSAGMNQATLKEFECSWLVTKDTGTSGGFYEKLEGARLANAKVVIINAPKENGMDVAGTLERILDWSSEEKMEK